MKRIALLLTLLFTLGTTGVTAQDEELPFNVVDDTTFCTLLAGTDIADSAALQRDILFIHTCVEMLDPTVFPESLFPTHPDYMVVWAARGGDPVAEDHSEHDHEVEAVEPEPTKKPKAKAKKKKDNHEDHSDH